MMNSVKGSQLRQINQDLQEDWEARLNVSGRIYYVNHHTQTSQWIPPKESWTATDNGVPYGWEPGIDKTGKTYFINHVDKTTISEEPRDDLEDALNQPRVINLQRDEQLGFGFVAGSEKPVIVRFVTEGGPSEDKLLPGDQLLKINEEDVATSAREHVIELVRSCKETITLLVCQPQQDNSLRKSALLTAAKKARLKNHPSRVRFAEAVIVNGAPVVSPSTQESYIPFMPNVLKVFLENGQTKSFKYDNKTTVKDVMNSLQEKLKISCIDHFSLVLQNVRRPSQGGITLLQEHESLAEIAARPGSQHFKCLLRVMFVPKDAYDLLRKDDCAFEYFYMQCCNDVVQERFASELKYDVALRLASLNIQQHAISSNMSKISLKAIEKDCGLERFVPRSLLANMKGKDLRKMLGHYMKANQNLSAPGQKQLTALQAKLHYLKILGEMRSFGGKCFVATHVEKKAEVMVLIGPKHGIAVVTNIKANAVSTLAEYNDVETITVSKESDRMQKVILHLKDQDNPRITLSMLSDDVPEFIGLVEGYHRLMADKNRALFVPVQENTNNNKEAEAVPYESTHRVVPQPWSYADIPVSKVTDTEPQEEANDNNKPAETKPLRLVDLASGPPPYEETTQYIEDITVELNAPTTETPEVTNNETTADKPQELKVTEVRVQGEVKPHAPLASPDVSTLSGSSESSITQEEEGANEVGLDRVGPFGDTVSLDSVSIEDAKDTDSVTSSSVSTVISRSSTHVDCSVAEPEDPPMSMSKSDSDYDARFGARALKTFSSPKVVRKPVVEKEEKEQVVVVSQTELVTEHSQDVVVVPVDLKVKGEEVAREKSTSSEDVESDTESESTLSETTEAREHLKPLLPHGPLEVDLTQFSQSESDETDSISTPTDSPCKARLDSLDVQPPPLFSRTDRPQSFGMHSPDKMPRSETEFQRIACSFGLHSPEKGLPQPESEPLHPSYNPRLFCDGGLYLDPDIIDLTLIPPPKTPDQEPLMDFASEMTTSPPPGFSDGDSVAIPPGQSHDDEDVEASDMLPTSVMDLPTPIKERIDAMIQNDEEFGMQEAAINALMIGARYAKVDDAEGKESGIESESDSGNETISSENIDFSSSGFHELLGSSTSDYSQLCNSSPMPGTSSTFEHDDIDAFIASVTVPPPPGDDQETAHPPPSVEDNGVSVDGPPLIETGPGSLTDYVPPLSPISEHHTWESSRILDEEIAKLVIPPPPISSLPNMDEIPIVPPVDLKTPSPVSDKASPPRREWASSLASHPIHALTRSSSSASQIQSGTTAPPGVHVEHQRSSSVPVEMNIDHKPRPPVPPKRLSSLESPSSTGSSAPTSPTTQSLGGANANAASPRVQTDILRRPPQWRPSSAQGRQTVDDSAANDSVMKTVSELYAKRLVTTMGTLPRQRGKKTPPPPPPPRRSSIASSPQVAPPSPGKSPLCDAGTSDTKVQPGDVSKVPSGDVSKVSSGDVIKVTTDDVSKDISKSQTDQISKVSGYTTQVPPSDTPPSDGNKVPPSDGNKAPPSDAPSSPGSRYAGAVGAVRKAYENLFRPPAKSTETTASKTSAQNASPKPPVKNSKLRVDINKCNAASKKPEQSPSVVAMVERIDSPRSADSSAMKSKIKAYVSPTIQRRQTEYLENASSSVSTPGDFIYVGSASPKVGRSQTFNTGTPRDSPVVQRHSSFSQASERSPSPFRTFLGERSPGSPSSTPNSPLRSPGVPPQQSLVLAKAALKPVGSATCTTETQQTKDGGKNDLPPRVPYPVATTTSVTPTTSPSPPVFTSAQGETGSHSRSPTLPRSPLSSFVSPNHAGAKLPASPRKSATLPSSPRRNGSLQSPRSGIPRPAVPPPTVPSIGEAGNHKNHNGSTPTNDLPQSDLVLPSDAVVQEILNKTYTGDSVFELANRDVDILVVAIDKTIDKLNAADRVVQNREHFKTYRDGLLADSRTFVTDSKLLVSSATHSKEKLVLNLNSSMHTLGRIVRQCKLTLLTMTSPTQAINLGSKVKDVTLAYRTTLNAAHDAAGKPLSDPNMKMLMRQATSLAAILSALMKTLKGLDNNGDH